MSRSNNAYVLLYRILSQIRQDDKDFTQESEAPLCDVVLLEKEGFEPVEKSEMNVYYLWISYPHIMNCQ